MTSRQTKQVRIKLTIFILVANLNTNSNQNSGPHAKHNLKMLRSQIVNINLNLFLANPIEYMNKFLSLWMNEKNRYIVKDKQYKLSMIEILVNTGVSTDVVLAAVIRNVNATKIKDYKKSKVKIKDFYPFYLNKDQLTYEAKLCQFVYSYIIFNSNLRVDKTCVDIWNEIINLFLIFMESKAPSTFFWIVEILNIMLYKLPIRETLTQDKSIRTKLTTIVNTLFTKIMELSVNNKVDIIFEEASCLILPMNPSMYEKVTLEVYNKEIYKINSALHERLNIEKNQMVRQDSGLNINLKQSVNPSSEDYESDESIRSFYQILYDYVANGTVLKNEELLVSYRNIGFITLKSLFYSTMKNIYLPDRNDKLVIHVQTVVKSLINIMNERIGVNKIYVDLATEFFHSLMMNATALTSNSCKTMIMDFFLEPVRFYI
jgi:hypothetical protein